MLKRGSFSLAKHIYNKRERTKNSFNDHFSLEDCFFFSFLLLFASLSFFFHFLYKDLYNQHCMMMKKWWMMTSRSVVEKAMNGPPKQHIRQYRCRMRKFFATHQLLGTPYTFFNFPSFKAPTSSVCVCSPRPELASQRQL